MIYVDGEIKVMKSDLDLISIFNGLKIFYYIFRKLRYFYYYCYNNNICFKKKWVNLLILIFIKFLYEFFVLEIEKIIFLLLK